MAVIKSNVVKILVQAKTSYQCTIELSAEATELPYTGGDDTFTAVVKDSSGNPVPNVEVVLTDLTTGSSTSSITDENGTATFTVTFPPNDTSQEKVYQFVASANV